MPFADTDVSPVTPVSEIKHNTQQCHKCPVNAIIQNMANESAERIASAKMTCEKCKGWNESHVHVDGESMVFLGGLLDTESFLAAEMDADALPRNHSRLALTGLDEKTEDKLLGFFVTLSKMRKNELLLFWCFLRGLTYTAAGAEIGITKQAAQQGFFRMVQKYPVMGAIIPQYHTSIKTLADVTAKRRK